MRRNVRETGGSSQRLAHTGAGAHGQINDVIMNRVGLNAVEDLLLPVAERRKILDIFYIYKYIYLYSF